MISAVDIEIQDGVWPCPNDALNRKDEIELLTPMLLNMQSPAVMALDAPWGQGKTTFIRLWQEYLKSQSQQFVHFNAWESDFAADPLLPMLAAFDVWLKNNAAVTCNTQDWNKLKSLGGKILKAGVVAAIKVATINTIDASELIEEVVSGATGEIAGNVVDEFNGQMNALEQFRALLTSVVNTLPEGQPNLIVFIDELDRCRPNYAIELLERVKHLFNIPRVVFVLGMDSGELSESIKAVYGAGFNASKYLGRFVEFDYRMKYPSKTNYINATIDTPALRQYFGTDNSKNYDREQLVKCIGLLSDRFSIDLRRINQIIARLNLMLSSGSTARYLDAPLLAVLLVLRQENEILYRRYVNRPDIADEVMSYISQGMPFDIMYSDEMATITSFVIAASNRELSDKRLEELQRSYLKILEAPEGKSPEIKTFVDRVIDLSTHLRRGREASSGPGEAFRKIELVQSMRMAG